MLEFSQISCNGLIAIPGTCTIPSILFPSSSLSFHLQGLRVQDNRDISPWDILEGVKNSGPLMLSWFGAVRLKRKPLKYEEQRWMVQFHTHQDQFQDMMYQPHYVSLPEAAAAVPSVMEDTTKTEDEASLADTAKESSSNQVSGSSTNTTVPTPSVAMPTSSGVGVASQPPISNQPQVSGAVRPPPSVAMPTQSSQQAQFTINQTGMGQRAPGPMNPMMMSAGRGMGRGMMGGAGAVSLNRMIQPGMNQTPLSARPDMRMRLEQIRAANLQQQHVRTGAGVQYAPGPGGVMIGNPPPNYRSPMNTMNPVGPGVGHDPSQQLTMQQQQQLMYQRHQQMQRRLMAARLQQQQQMQRQRAAMMQAGYPQQQQYAMRPGPMQANPPMPMQQVMQPPQQPQYIQQATGGMMMRASRPPGQPMAYQPGMNPSMPQQPPMYR